VFVRTQASEPHHLLETERLLELWPRAPCIKFTTMLFARGLRQILLLMLILSVYIYLVMAAAWLTRWSRSTKLLNIGPGYYLDG